MLKAGGTWDDGRPMLVIGLEPRNVELLQKGQPILIDMRSVGRPEAGMVLIMFGESPEKMARELGASDLLDAKIKGGA